MRWWLMSVPLVLLMSGCAEVEDVAFGDNGFFDQVVAPTVERSLTSPPPPRSRPYSRPPGKTPHPYDYGRSTRKPKPSSVKTPHPYDYGRSTRKPKPSSGKTAHPYDYGKSTSKTTPSSSSSSSSGGPTYKMEPVKSTPSLPDFGTESPGLEPRDYKSTVHSSSSGSAGKSSTPDPNAVYRPTGNVSGSTAAGRGSASRPSQVNRPSNSGTKSSRSRTGTAASRPASSSADDQ